MGTCGPCCRVTDRTVRSGMARLVAEGHALAVGSGPHDPQRCYFGVSDTDPAGEVDQ